jgi:N-acetylmuramic acid 6-phosphate etherase
VYENLMVDLRATNDKLRDRASRIVGTLTGLARPDALALLDRAGGRVKVAVLMHRRHVDAAEAERLLDAGGGRLDRALKQ